MRGRTSRDQSFPSRWVIEAQQRREGSWQPPRRSGLNGFGMPSFERVIRAEFGHVPPSVEEVRDARGQ